MIRFKNISLQLLMALFLLTITIQCDPGVNWNRTLKSNKKGPYGTYILHKEIQALLQSDTLNSINKSVYDYFDDFYDYGNEEYNTSGSYIFVHDYTNNLGVSAAEELLIWASHGNDVFIAAKRFPKTLRDSLGFETKILKISFSVRLFLLGIAFQSFSFFRTISLGFNFIFSIIDLSSFEVRRFSR